MQASIFRLDLCQPMASTLPVGERGFRHIPVSWATLKQAALASKLYLMVP
jgi:hypothetical protein